MPDGSILLPSGLVPNPGVLVNDGKIVCIGLTDASVIDHSSFLCFEWNWKFIKCTFGIIGNKLTSTI